MKLSRIIAAPTGGMAARAAQRRWLPEGRTGPMPWIIGIMMFFTILFAAAGASLGIALTRLHGQLAGGYTVQIVDANAGRRAASVDRVRALLMRDARVSGVSVVPDPDLARQLAPWFGTDLKASELPIPSLVDFTVKDGTSAAQGAAIVAAIRRAVPAARVEAHETYLAPVGRVMRSLVGLAAAMIVLMAGATAAVVALAARAAYAAHRETIDIMHLLGATDRQIARLFQRRLALDATLGGVVGLAGSVIAIGFFARSGAGIDAELVRMMAFPAWMWALLALIPVLGALLAMLTARVTVGRALERTL